MTKSLRLFSTLFIGILLVTFSYLTVDYSLPLYNSFGNAQWVEDILSARLKQPVTIGQISTQWHGLQPVVEITDFAILNPDRSKALHVNYLRFGVNLFASFMKWKIIPGDISLEGSHLILKELPDGKLDINGVPALQADLRSKNSVKIDYLIDSFLTTGLKNIKDLDITWYDKTGRVVLPISHLNFTEHSHFLFHRFKGHALIWNQSPATFKGNTFGSFLLKKMLYTSNRFDITNLHLENYKGLSQFTKGFAVKEGVGKLILQIAAKPNQALNFSGQFDGHNINIVTDHLVKYAVSSLATDFYLSHKPNHWYAGLNHFNLTIGNEVLPIHKLSYEQNTETKRQIIKLDLLPIEKMIGFALENHLLSDSIKIKLTGLKPSGSIKHFSLERGSNSSTDLIIKGDLQNISFASWQKYPGIQNLSGQLDFSPLQGKFNLSSSNSIFQFQPMFRSPILVKKSRGQVIWQHDASNNLLIKIKNIALKLKAAEATGYLNIILPKEKGSPEVNSKVSFKIKDVTEISTLYPVTTTPVAVVKWLDKSIKGGVLDKGIFILNGRLSDFPFDKGNGKFLISGQLENGKLHYLDSWPDIENLKARLLFKGRSMTIISHYATTLGARISYVNARIDNLEKSILNIKGKLETLNHQVVKVNSTNNPLLHSFSLPYLDKLSVRGKWQLGLNLLLPLDKTMTFGNKFSGSVRLDQVDITTDDLSINKLMGNINFSENSFNTQNLIGNLASYPFQLTSTTNTLPEGQNIHMLLRGNIGTLALQKMSKLTLLNAFKGGSAYQMSADILKPAEGQLHSKVTIDSNLQGIKADLPQPFDKLSQTSLPSHFIFEQQGPHRKIAFNYGDKIKAIFAYKQNHNQYLFDRGSVAFNNEASKLPLSQGLKIEGNLTSFNLDTWKPFLSSTKTTSWHDKISHLYALINHVNLRIDEVQLGGLNFQKLNITSASTPDALSFFINSIGTQGEIKMPKTFPAYPIKINLQSFQLPPKQAIENKLSPNDIPPVDLSITDLRYKNKLIKNIDLKLRPEGNNLFIKQLSLKEPSLKIIAQGVWRKMKGHQETVLKGNMDSSNLGAILNQWQLTDNVVKGTGEAHFNLSWADSPLNLESKLLSGTIDLRFSKGRIIKLSNQANFGMGMGRMLTLFSLQTLPRRLMLDFSDLTEPGFSFDEMKGVLQFRQGNVYTDNASMDGPVAKVRIWGRIGLGAKDYNLRLSINPYVTSSLPVVATLTAGPIVGAATWLIDKVFSHQVKQMTEIHYNVTGSWDNPNLKNLTEHTNNGQRNE